MLVDGAIRGLLLSQRLWAAGPELKALFTPGLWGQSLSFHLGCFSQSPVKTKSYARRSYCPACSQELQILESHKHCNVLPKLHHKLQAPQPRTSVAPKHPLSWAHRKGVAPAAEHRPCWVACGGEGLFCRLPELASLNCRLPLESGEHGSTSFPSLQVTLLPPKNTRFISRLSTLNAQGPESDTKPSRKLSTPSPGTLSAKPSVRRSSEA